MTASIAKKMPQHKMLNNNDYIFTRVTTRPESGTSNPTVGPAATGSAHPMAAFGAVAKDPETDPLAGANPVGLEGHLEVDAGVAGRAVDPVPGRRNGRFPVIGRHFGGVREQRQADIQPGPHPQSVEAEEFDAPESFTPSPLALPVSR